MVVEVKSLAEDLMKIYDFCFDQTTVYNMILLQLQYDCQAYSKIDHIKPYPFSILIHFVAKKCGGAGQGGGGVRSLVRRSTPKDCALFNHSVAYLYLVGCG